MTTTFPKFILDNLTESELRDKYRYHMKRHQCTFTGCDTIDKTVSDTCSIDGLCEKHTEMVDDHQIFTLENIIKYCQYDDLCNSVQFKQVLLQAKSNDNLSPENAYTIIKSILKAQRYTLRDEDHEEPLYYQCKHYPEMVYKCSCENDLLYQYFVKNGESQFDDMEELEYACISRSNSEQTYTFWEIPECTFKLDLFFEYWRRQVDECVKYIEFVNVDDD